jgi:hypothetical protein
MLKRLNPPLQKERHELRTRQRTSTRTLQNLDASQQGLDILHLSFVGGESHDDNFFRSLLASKGAMP